MADKPISRDMPPQEGLIGNRFDRAARLGFGEGSSIYMSAYVYGEVRVGKKTWIGPNVILDGSGGPLVIGDYCSISAGVQIYTHDTVLWAVTMGGADYRKGPGVTIGNGVYIGPNAVVSRGATTGDRVIVCANSVVPARAVVISGWKVRGNPARRVETVRRQCEK